MEKIDPKFTWCEISPYNFEPTTQRLDKDGVYIVPHYDEPTRAIIDLSNFKTFIPPPIIPPQ